MLLDLEKISFLHFLVLLGVESLWMGVGSPFQTLELKSKEALMVNAHTSRREKKAIPPVGKLSDFRKKCNVATVPMSNVG